MTYNLQLQGSSKSKSAVKKFLRIFHRNTKKLTRVTRAPYAGMEDVINIILSVKELIQM